MLGMAAGDKGQTSQSKIIIHLNLTHGVTKATAGKLAYMCELGPV